LRGKAGSYQLNFNTKEIKDTFLKGMPSAYSASVETTKKEIGK